MEIIVGDLLKADRKFIAQQVNCYTIRAKGLATKLHDAFPWANVYKDRISGKNHAHRYGSISVHGNPQLHQRFVINIYGQLYPGQPRWGRDSAAARLLAFDNALKQIEKLPELHSIGFPAGIGCGQAEGNWKEYYNLLEAFDNRLAGQASVTLFAVSEAHLAKLSPWL